MPSSNQFPVEISVQRILRPNLQVFYPVVKLSDPMVAQIINNKILQLTYELINMQGYFQNPSIQVTGGFEIKNNQRGILSLTLNNYGYPPQAAHGMTYIKSLTFNVQTGHVYSLSDLFKPNSPYVQVISDMIRLQIGERNLPLLGEFGGIRPDQDFYIADKALVIYFQLYEITPYYVGLPMFPISVYSLQDIARENGVLEIMMPAI